LTDLFVGIKYYRQNFVIRRKNTITDGFFRLPMDNDRW